MFIFYCYAKDFCRFPYIFKKKIRVRSFISNISYYLPEHIITNADLSAQFPGISEDEIYRRTGVKVRHIALNEHDRSKDAYGSDIAYLCALKFFKEHSIDPSIIDFLLVCTEGMDYKAPTTANILQDRLGLSQQMGAMDIPMGCTGYVNGLSIAKGLIESGQANNVLFLTSEVPSYVIHPKDLELRMLFGDAAAATLICAENTNETKIGPFVFGSDGSGAKHMKVRSSGAREPVDEAWLEKYKDAHGMKYGIMEMNGQEVFVFALQVVPPMMDKLLEKSGLTIDEIDLFVFHQANGFLLETLRKKLKIPPEKFFTYLEMVGNTISVTIPIALKEAIDAGKAKKGDKIALISFGVGYAWASTIITL